MAILATGEVVSWGHPEYGALFENENLALHDWLKTL